VQILAPTLKRGERSLTRRFTTVKVYDVSDAEGASFVVPVLSPHTRGQEERVAELLGQLTEWVLRSGLGLRLESPEINNAVDGATDGRTIWIRPDLTDADRLLVLSHEIAHVKLHFRKKQRGHSLLTDNTGQALSRDTRELEAELAAFLLLAFAGIDSSRGSAAYLNCWNASAAEIRSHAEKVFVVACCVLRDCEKKRYH
jgi:hypothetical protein